ncbi:hypothetical protein SDC9_89996 [bioreactor metagenome]|uniref:Beta-lactamase-related domain-containing protein n=1 Tax=bioreactor metagenome TaxID=1076179 RepID=A0A644ZXF9_9ZZZZ
MTVQKDIEYSSCQDAGISADAIIAMLDDLQANDLELHAITILKNNKLVAEGSWYPFEQGEPHRLFSATKSFLSTALGIAYDQKKIRLHDKVLSFFPEIAIGRQSVYLSNLTIHHLATMSMGQQFEPFFHHDLDIISQTLNKPIIKEPGSIYYYSSAYSHVLSAIISKVMQQSMEEVLQKYLYEPLNITHAFCEEDKNGVSCGGWGYHMTTHDLAKLGLLYLNNGVYNGKRILSAEWVRLATSQQITTDREYSSDKYANTNGYGYHWWLCRNNGYRASGLFGQTCFVYPDQRLVVACSSAVSGSQPIMDRIEKYLLSACDQGGIVSAEKQHQLAYLLANLRLREDHHHHTSYFAERINHRDLPVISNSGIYQFVRFDFTDDKTLHFGIKKAGQWYTIACGYEQWLKAADDSMVDFVPWKRKAYSYLKKSEYYTASKQSAYYTWKEDTELEINMRFSDRAIRLKWFIRFDWDDIRITYDPACCEPAEPPVEIAVRI